jgi:hypothetical protein
MPLRMMVIRPMRVRMPQRLDGRSLYAPTGIAPW